MRPSLDEESQATLNNVMKSWKLEALSSSQIGTRINILINHLYVINNANHLHDGC